MAVKPTYTGTCTRFAEVPMRADVLIGDRDRAQAAYKDFLALWKDADPNIPVLNQAKAEYAKLQ